jgi:hypothetical protein
MLTSDLIRQLQKSLVDNGDLPVYGLENGVSYDITECQIIEGYTGPYSETHEIEKLKHLTLY